MPQLPTQVNSTGVSVIQTTPSILLAYQVSSTQGQFDSAYLNGLIYEQLYYQLERIPGVAQATLFGGSNPAFWLFVDPDKLSANQLTADQVVAAVRSQNAVAVGGLVGGPPAGGQQLFTYPILVKNNGNLVSVEDLNRLIVGRSPQGNVLRLQDVGQAIYGFNTFATQGTDIHGYPAITIGVYQTPESNALQVSEAVVSLMHQFTSQVPPGVTVSSLNLPLMV
jgi:multidrug efflux pump subunit AcrB